MRQSAPLEAVIDRLLAAPHVLDPNDMSESDERLFERLVVQLRLQIADMPDLRWQKAR